jgi:hypothetical protein
MVATGAERELESEGVRLMRASILHEIIECTDALDMPASAKEQFKRLVRHLGAAHGASGMAHAEHVDYARRLLHSGVSRPTARDRLMALFAISRSQAYKVMHDSLNCSE